MRRDDSPRHFSSLSERLANLATRFVVHPLSHWLAAVLVIVWLATGPAFAARPEAHDTIEQVVGGRASNRVLNAEEVSEEEQAAFRRHFAILQRLSETGASPLTQAEAYRRHAEEQERLRARASGDDEGRRAGDPASSAENDGRPARPPRDAGEDGSAGEGRRGRGSSRG